MYFTVLHQTTGFSSMKAPELKGSWRKVEAWHYERPGKATDEDLASVTVETLGLRGHEVKLRLGTESEFLKRHWEAIGQSATPVAAEILACRICQDHGMTTETVADVEQSQLYATNGRTGAVKLPSSLAPWRP